MKRIFVFVVSIMLCACSKPYGDAWDNIVDRVSNLSTAVHGDMRLFTANYNAVEYLLRKPKNQKIGEIRCFDPVLGNDLAPLTRELTVKDFLMCLDEDWHRTFSDCHNRFFNETVDANRGKSCSYADADGFVFEDMPSNVAPHNVSDEDIASAMIAAPHVPPPLVGVFATETEWFVLLCALDAHYACPQKPDGSGASPSGGAPGGGDR